MNNEVDSNLPLSNAIEPDSKKPLDDLDLSHLILIKNPNNELAIGYSTERKLLDPLNASCTEKLVTHQHYGTFVNSNSNSNYPIFTVQEFVEAKAYSLLIKYTVLIMSSILITLDIKNIKLRVSSQDEIIAELRTIHIQMDDIQLYQFFWSFLVVYVVSLIFFILCVVVSVIRETPLSIRYTFRLLMFTLIYQFIEVILRRYDFLIIFLRIVLILLIKIWLRLAVRIKLMLLIFPEFASLPLRNTLNNLNGT